MYQIDSIQSVLREEFKDNKRKWEETENDSERAEIKDGYYWFKNKTLSRWNYYKTKTKLKEKQDFVVEINLELVEKADAFGHFGLIWGFDNARDYLNRFTISANGQRSLIMHFEKDHKKTIHRFHMRNEQKINMNKPVRLSLVRIGSYFHFFINKKKIYCAHQSLFCNAGPYIGFYIEPGLFVKSNFMEVKRMTTKQLLFSNEMHGLFE